jgi:hypothetical protein
MKVLEKPLKHPYKFGTERVYTARTISYRETHVPQARGATHRDVSHHKNGFTAVFMCLNF